MTKAFVPAGVLLLTIVVVGIAQQNPTRPQPARPARPTGAAPPAAAAVQPSAPANRAQDEQQVLAVIRAMDKAFNARDAKALAALFTADAEIVDEEGVVTHGRDKIQEVFAAVFEEFPQARLETDVVSLRFLSPTVAVEEGHTAATYDPQEPPVRNRYVVIHVKEGGKWQMASARDYPQPETAGDEQLQQLAWLIGDWVDESADSLVATSYAWADNGHYIVSHFDVQIAGRPAMSGTQRLGWDPLAKQVRSWVFDSEGGFAEGMWTRDGDQWIVKLRGVTKDGKVASGTNIFTKLSDSRLTWQSRDRVVGGERIADVGEVLVVRRPPQPGKQ